MTSMMSEDERFAAFFKSAVQALDVPEPPREAMWAAISARRQVERAPTVVAPAIETPLFVASSTPSGAATSRVSTPAFRGVPMRWAVPMAMGLLAVGIGIGTVVNRPAAPTAAPQQMATDMQPLPKSAPAQVAARQHFTEVQQLLATFASSPHGTSPAGVSESAQADARMSAWARRLLVTTQLFLDSPDIDDSRRKLLVDLESVLMQMSQLSSPSNLPEDREFVEEAISRAQLQQRLRYAMPSNLQQGI